MTIGQDNNFFKTKIYQDVSNYFHTNNYFYTNHDTTKYTLTNEEIKNIADIVYDNIKIQNPFTKQIIGFKPDIGTYDYYAFIEKAVDQAFTLKKESAINQMDSSTLTQIKILYKKLSYDEVKELEAFIRKPALIHDIMNNFDNVNEVIASEVADRYLLNKQFDPAKSYWENLSFLVDYCKDIKEQNEDIRAELESPNLE